MCIWLYRIALDFVNANLCGFICHRVQVWRLGYNVKLQQSSKEIWLELTDVLKVI